MTSFIELKRQEFARRTMSDIVSDIAFTILKKNYALDNFGFLFEEWIKDRIETILENNNFMNSKNLIDQFLDKYSNCKYQEDIRERKLRFIYLLTEILYDEYNRCRTKYIKQCKMLLYFYEKPNDLISKEIILYKKDIKKW